MEAERPIQRLWESLGSDGGLGEEAALNPGDEVRFGRGFGDGTSGRLAKSEKADGGEGSWGFGN